MNPNGIIDLFSGVGGLSLGAARAGFDVVCSLEKDPIISQMHQVNFPNCEHINCDIGTIHGSDIIKLAKSNQSCIAGIIGGPPCQGFSSIGKKNPNDPRNQLLTTFFSIVAELQPPFYLAENVPGVLADRNRDVLRNALSVIPHHYTKLDPIELDASDFGAPTSRKRVFFIGFDPTRMKSFSCADLQPTNQVKTTVRHAFKGIPNTHESWKTPSQTWQVVSYSDYSEYTNSLKGNIPHGVGCASAIRKFTTNNLVSGFIGTYHTDSIKQRYKNLPHGKIDPISRSAKLEWDKPCRTLRAGTGSERGSFQAVRPIHPDYPRVISPREAARLQGFPDWFQFGDTIWHSFRMIGNSVSPILSEALLRTIRSNIIQQ